MIQIVPYQPADRDTLIAFVEAIQEHERMNVPGLKPAHTSALHTQNSYFSAWISEMAVCSWPKMKAVPSGLRAPGWMKMTIRCWRTASGNMLTSPTYTLKR